MGYYPKLEAVNLSYAWQAGYELWRFEEPKMTAIGHQAITKHSRNHLGFQSSAAGSKGAGGNVVLGPGQLEWATRQVADIYAGAPSSHPKFMMEYKGALYFQAHDNINGTEMWVADAKIEDVNGLKGRESPDGIGSRPYPVIYFDFMPGLGSSNPSWLTVHKDWLYFSADGVDLSWMVIADHRDDCRSFRQSAVDPQVFYAVSESTTWNPNKIYDCPAGYHWASSEEAQRHFTSKYQNYRDHMWVSEAGGEIGLQHGKQEAWHVQDFEMATSVKRKGDGLHPYSGKVYFDQCGWKGYEWGNKRRTHFRFSDSSKNGFYKHAGRDELYVIEVDTFEKSGILMTEEFAGIVCISGENRLSNKVYEKTGQELWRTDGTPANTERVADINVGVPGSHPKFLTSFDDYLYFSAYTKNDGRELWRTKGNSEEVWLVSPGSTPAGIADTPVAVHGASQDKGINPGILDSDPADLTVVGDVLVLAATSRTSGREMWMVNKTSNDIQSKAMTLIDIVPGAESSSPSGFCSSGGVFPVYFTANGGGNGETLWKSDGTESGTVIVKTTFDDDNPLPLRPRYLTWFSGNLYFQAFDRMNGAELWKSDGSSGGTTLLMDIRQGTASSKPAFFTIMPSLLDGKEYLMFVATDGTDISDVDSPVGLGGVQLWRSDGYASNTRRAFDRTANDLYVDFDGLDARSHPATMTVFKDGLYLPGNNGMRNDMVPRGGFKPQGERGIEQAVVVKDVDTPPGGNVTMILEATAGALIVENDVDRSSWSKDHMYILLGEHREEEQLYLYSALTAAGHTVDVAVTGTEIFNKATNASGDAEHRYDIVFIELNLPIIGVDKSTDGLDLARSIRFYENEREFPPSPQLFSPLRRTWTATGPRRNLLVGIADINPPIDAQKMAIDAGMDLFLSLPQIGAFDGDKTHLQWNDHDAGRRDTFQTAEMKGLKTQKASYKEFVEEIERFVFKQHFEVNITALAVDVSASVPKFFSDSFKTVLASQRIQIEGTIQQVNNQMRLLYFYAPNGTIWNGGDVTLNVTVIDKPLNCHPTDILKLPRVAGSDRSSYNLSLCDWTFSKKTSALIPIFVEKYNQAPTIDVSYEDRTMPLMARLEALTEFPELNVADVDNEMVKYMNTTRGRIATPPMSMTITVLGKGRLSLLLRENLVFLQGDGKLDKMISMRAMVTDINAALKTLRYTCRSQDGCKEDMLDSVHFLVDDDGFAGKGGPLIAETTIQFMTAAAVDKTAEENYFRSLNRPEVEYYFPTEAYHLNKSGSPL